MERFHAYFPGAFHPIHIGDLFKSGRYTVVHKLGHGSYSTVWLAKDSTTETFVSLKVLAADPAKWSGNPNSVREELEVHSRLRDAAHEPGKDFVAHLIDDFVHVGPNGEHQCIVTELLGPPLASDIDDLYDNDILPAVTSKAIIKQVASAVQFLHRNNIAHGDLNMGNILLTSPKLSSLSNDDVEHYFGQVAKFVVKDGVEGVWKPPHAPQYIVCAPDPLPLLELCLSDPANVHVKLCDFSESSIVTPDGQPKKMNMPLMFRAPEVILTKPLMPALSTDIWALAVLFHVVSTGGRPIFKYKYHRHSEDDILKDIVLRLGKLPEPFWSAWDERAQFFDEDGRPLEESTEEAPLLWYRNKLIDDEERVLFEKMLRPMLMLEPTKRATIDDVLTSESFVKYCKGCMAPPSTSSAILVDL
ncbi:hypothetical protein D9619_010370 [Psilocybe cf. subviscida]|uniref:non-specific serine/threonine protein kinase n=1 Tax=Psilocybe cf. subviscida TaxID=2480587 RepID=A0A8H5ASX6_9AGAR|nr:hypothetical protein D9619_010370 [Psilocybe cf. subviscida]